MKPDFGNRCRFISDGSGLLVGAKRICIAREFSRMQLRYCLVIAMKLRKYTELKISVKRGYLFCTPSEPLIQQPTVAHNPVVNKKSLSSFKTPSSPFQLDQIYLSSYKPCKVGLILESLWPWKNWSHSVKSKNGIFGFTSKQAATTFISF